MLFNFFPVAAVGLFPSSVYAIPPGLYTDVLEKKSLIRTYSRYSLHGAIRIHKNHDLYSFYPCMFTYLQHRFSTNVSIIWKIKKKKMIGLGGMVNVLNKLTKNQCLIHVFVLRNLSC